MPEYRPLAVERQVFLIGIWRNVTLNDVFLREIQIQEEMITDKICQLQLSPSGFFLFAKTGNHSTGYENGVLLHKIYSIASKKSKPEHLLCIIDEEVAGKFAVILLRCSSLKDSFLIQNTMKELWDVCFVTDKHFLIKNEPSGRVKSMLRGSYGSDNSWQKSDSEKSEDIYTSGSIITLEEFTKYQNDTQTCMASIREQLHMIYSEIAIVKDYLKNHDMSDAENIENVNEMKGMKYLKAMASKESNKKQDGDDSSSHSTGDLDVDILKASQLSDSDNEDYILLRNNLVQKSHDGYFQEKSIRFKPNYLHSDPFFGKTSQDTQQHNNHNHNASEGLNSKENQTSESVRKSNTMVKGGKTTSWTFLQELFDFEPSIKESRLAHSTNYTPYSRKGIKCPVDEVYRKRQMEIQVG